MSVYTTLEIMAYAGPEALREDHPFFAVDPEDPEGSEGHPRENLELGISRIRSDSAARQRILAAVERQLACFDTKAPEFKAQFEALLDLYTGTPLDDWRARWRDNPLVCIDPTTEQP